MSLVAIVSSIYLLSTICYISFLWTQNKRVTKLGFYLIITATLIQTVNFIYLFINETQIAGGLNKSLYLFSWFISIVYIISQIRFKAEIMGAFVAPMALIMTIPKLILPQGLIDHEQSLSNPWILTHIILMFLAEAVFTVAFIAGILYIFQEKQIKSKHVAKFLNKLPSLTALDKINHLSLLIGFPIVTLGLAIGLLAANEIWGQNWIWGQKETWSIITWLLYAVLIHGRLSSGWKGRKAAFGAVLGFGIICFTFFFIGYFAPGQHDFLGIK